jgi:hypothetical protein
MSDLIDQPLQTIVFHEGNLDLYGGLLPFSGDLRLLKASALYADTVSSFYFSVRAGSVRRSSDEYGEAVCDYAGDNVADGYWRVPTCVVRGPDSSPLARGLPRNDARCLYADACRDLALALQAGVLTIGIPHFDAGTVVVHSTDDLLWAEDHLASPTSQPNSLATRRRIEGAIAATLLGQLEAFPDASMDVILDVRERIADARVYFRTAIAQAASEIEDAAETMCGVGPLVTDLRRRVIDEALERIRQDLDALGARSSLLRLAKDKFTVTSAGATLAIVVGAGGGSVTQALLSGAIGAPLIAATAGEIEHRQQQRTELRARPYWLLHEAGEVLHQSQSA